MKFPNDKEAQLIESLKCLGLTRYESLVYIGLLRMISATASEIHEISGVPRVSVYPILDQLREKDLVIASQTSPKRFAARSPEQGIASLIDRVERSADYARRELSVVYCDRQGIASSSDELIWNVHGFENIRKQLVELIQGAKKEIRIMGHFRILQEEVQKILETRAENVDTEIITSSWTGTASGPIRLYIMRPPRTSRRARACQGHDRGRGLHHRW